MQRTTTLTTICAIVFACVAITLFLEKQTIAHPNKDHETSGIVTCYLIGYPRTNCGSRAFVDFDKSWNLNDHKWDWGKFKFVHKPGRAGHATDTRRFRKNKTSNTYTSCDDCTW